MGDRSLEPISPEDATEWYLSRKGPEVTDDTVESYRTSLSYFAEYCKECEITNLNVLTGRHIERYRTWRREDSTGSILEPKTMRDEMYLYKDFIRYLESIEGVTDGLHRKVQIPQLGPNDGVSDIQLESARAKGILRHLGKFEYASLDHVFWSILCETGRRIGGLHSLDVGDYQRNVENPYLAFRHRPDQGTRLKNGPKGDTNVNISNAVCEVIDDYTETKRPDVEDEYGREPLLAPNKGRLSTSTMRKYVYRWTRPCEVGRDCPHQRVIDECDAAQDAHQASKCPSTVSPHAIRHGYISEMLDSETPKPILSERCDVSEPVIDQHYDERSEAEKQDLRKRILERIYKNDQVGYAR